MAEMVETHFTLSKQMMIVQSLLLKKRRRWKKLFEYTLWLALPIICYSFIFNMINQSIWSLKKFTTTTLTILYVNWQWTDYLKKKKRLYSFIGNVIACIALFTINYLSFSRTYHYSCFSWLFSFEFLCGAMKRCMELTRAEIHNFIRLAYTLLPYDWNHLYWKFTAASWKRNYDQFGFHFLQN